MFKDFKRFYQQIEWKFYLLILFILSTKSLLISSRWYQDIYDRIDSRWSFFSIHSTRTEEMFNIFTFSYQNISFFISRHFLINVMIILLNSFKISLTSSSSVFRFELFKSFIILNLIKRTLIISSWCVAKIVKVLIFWLTNVLI